MTVGHSLNGLAQASVATGQLTPNPKQPLSHGVRARTMPVCLPYGQGYLFWGVLVKLFVVKTLEIVEMTLPGRPRLLVAKTKH